MLIASNANPKDIQYEMGHSDIMVTYNLYGHLFHDEDAEQQRRDRAERLAESLS
jgi:integrase